MAQQDADLVARIHALRPSDLEVDDLRALRDLGGEAKRAEIIDRALELGDWTQAELDVVSWYRGAARRVHLRTLADYAITNLANQGRVESAGAGRWRLTAPLEPRPTPVGPHPFGRVFMVGVGLADEPVGDDWRLADQGHLWLTTRSRTLSRGDHVFVLGAGRRSTVLGVAEVTSAGTSSRPRNTFDPVRWPFAFAIQPLASVPPLQAQRVDGVVSPRGTVNQVNEKHHAALYAAAADFAVPAGADVAEVPASEAVRRPRIFDPDRTPGQVSTSEKDPPDPDEQAALHEKANHDHHTILVGLHARLTAAGWSDLHEIPGGYDLRATAPDESTAIFEAKTITPSNATGQCRSAVAQLLEYRLEFGEADDLLVVAVDAEPTLRRNELLDRLGIAAVLVNGTVPVRLLNEQAELLAL